MLLESDSRWIIRVLFAIILIILGMRASTVLNGSIFQFVWFGWMQVVYDLFWIFGSGCVSWFEIRILVVAGINHSLSLFGSTIRSEEPAK